MSGVCFRLYNGYVRLNEDMVRIIPVNKRILTLICSIAVLRWSFPQSDKE